MGLKFRAVKTAGQDAKAAIIEGSDDVLYDPYVDLSRVRCHSDFLYPSFTTTVSGSLTLPSIGADSARYHTYELYEHGIDGHPFVTGRILNHPSSGVHVALEGSVPFSGDSQGFARWLTLGASPTHVILHEQTITRIGVSMPSESFDYVLEISDLTVEDYDTSPPGGAILSITPDRMTLGEGKFDTSKRYLKAVAEEDKNTNFVGGETLVTGADSSLNGALSFEYSNGEYTYRKQFRFGSTPVENLDFTPNTAPVKL